MKRVVSALLLLVSTTFCQTRSRLADYALILADPPIAQTSHSRAELRSAQALAQRAKIVDAQSRVLGELKQRKIRVVSTSQMLLNAVFVRTTRDRAGDLPGIPGVVRVAYLPPLRMELDQAAGLVNASAAWSALGGVGAAGAGVKIGIIDSGIDQNHPGFQDPSLSPPTGFPKGDTDYKNYTNNKVIVARSYVSLSNDTSNPAYSTPDDTTPRDRVGHGTAIAMIAAGVANKGPASGMIQGIAPKAFLGNYKIFGSPGVIDYPAYPALVQAMEDAVSDGMDIVVLALGEGDPALYGPNDTGADCQADANTYCDPIPQMILTNAINNNVTVVVAAGNDGNTALYSPSLNTIHTPGTTPAAITVGASTNSHRFAAAVHVTGGQDYDAGFSDGPKPQAPISGQLKDVASLGNDGLACTALPGGSLVGAIALIQRGTCTFSNKINNAHDAGALGAIIYQQSGSDISLTGAPDTGIPAVMVGNADGLALKSLAASKSVTVALDPALHAIATQPDVVAGFSSRGPNIGTNDIKPELVAPGVGIYTATQKLDPNGDLYNASGYAAGSGTSYAVGMVAGAAALVKQKNPGFSPAQIKSALVNTATQDVVDETGKNHVISSGAGKLNVGNAVNATVTAQPATLSFGPITSPAALPASLTLSLTNSGSASANLTLTSSSAQVVVNPSSVTVAGNGRQSGGISVSLTGSLPGTGIHEGFIDISGSGVQTLHVPYLYIVPDGIPYNFLPAEGYSFISEVSDPGFWTLSFRLTDRYGIPVIGQPVQWSVISGAGSVGNHDAQTYALGFSVSQVYVGPQLGDQVFRATAAGVNYDFTGTAEPQPTIRSSQGVLNAAGGAAGPFAPGSYIAIYGSGLAPATSVETTTSLPVSLATVSVSFDSADGKLSLPGHIHFVSPGQVNVQIPWEFQGQSSVQTKVNLGFATTATNTPNQSTYTVPLATYSPGVFEYSDGGKLIAATIDVNTSLPQTEWFTNSYIVSQAKPATRGHVLELFLNGLGPVSNQPASGDASPGSPVAYTSASPTVTIGGVAAPVQFSGMTPGSIGLYQVNVTVPSNVPTGIQPIMVSIGGADSKASNLPVQ